MPIQIVPHNEQARGQFNGGAILENKPIGFPGEGGYVRPYSNLFYWAHAWSDHGSTIGEHPHQGFEIMSFVLKGNIDHYDSKYKAWKRLEAGDAQIIRAGNGISHAERLNAGSHIFQIWVDPNLNQTLQQSASYDDYPSKDFPVVQENGFTTKIYHGENAPMKLDSQGMEIKEINVSAGSHEINTGADKVVSIYLIEGSMAVNGSPMNENDFVIVNGEEKIALEVANHAHLFVISSLANVPYRTYAQMRGL